jgi:HK97 family phage portal protein
MGLLDRIFGRKAQKRSFVDYAMNSVATSQVVVTPETALTFSAVYGSVRVIAETIAQLPLNYYIKTDDGRQIYVDSPLQVLVNNEPNTYQTKYVFFETLINTLILYGNAYAYIERDNKGNPISLYCLHPDDIRVRMIDGSLIYTHKKANYDQSQIIHIPDMTLDGYTGISRITQARDNIALGISAQNYGKNLYESNCRVTGVLKHPSTLGPDAIKTLSDQWHRAYHTGYNGQFKTAILEENMDFKSIQLNPLDSAYLSSREFSIQEISRIMRVPPYKLAELSRATFSNIEHQSQEFLSDCIIPLLTKIEQEFNKKLIFENQKGKTYFEHNVNAFLRGDANSRADYYSKLFNLGVLSRNEIRLKENMNKIKDGGDEYFVPLNMLNIKEDGTS